MAKKFKKDNNNRLERTIVRNWIILGASLAAIVVLTIMSKMAG